MEKARKKCKTHCANLQAKEFKYNNNNNNNNNNKMQDNYEFHKTKKYFIKTTNSKHRLKKIFKQKSKVRTKALMKTIFIEMKAPCNTIVCTMLFQTLIFFGNLSLKLKPKP
jgi:hypothetical protein